MCGYYHLACLIWDGLPCAYHDGVPEVYKLTEQMLGGWKKKKKTNAGREAKRKAIKDNNEGCKRVTINEEEIRKLTDNR